MADDKQTTHAVTPSITIDLMAACRAALRYDAAIESCANDPDKMASYCTAHGDDLDTLYMQWIVLSRTALHRAEAELRESIDITQPPIE